MLQIIGWLGCLYLLVKAFELATSNSYRDIEGSIRGSAVIAAMIAFWGAVGFAIWLAAQGASSPAEPAPAVETSMSASQVECVQKAKTSEEILAC